MGFVSPFERRVRDTIRRHSLAGKNDRIIVACSGGKDSTAALHILHALGYETEALHIDLGMGEWSRKNRANLASFCEKRSIPLHVFTAEKEFGRPMPHLRSVIQLRTNLRNCSVCGVIRRWLINRKARELGATRLATGHNLDDEAQGVLMNAMKGSMGQCLSPGPKSGTRTRGFVPKIKPLYYCTNAEVRRYSLAKGFPVLYEPCPCSFDAFRQPFKEWLREAEAEFPGTLGEIVRWRARMLPALKKRFARGKAVFCSSCGEPSRNETCRACELLGLSL